MDKRVNVEVKVIWNKKLAINSKLYNKSVHSISLGVHGMPF